MSQPKRSRENDGGYTDTQTVRNEQEIIRLQSHIIYMEQISTLSANEVKMKSIWYQAHKKNPTVIAQAGQSHNNLKDWKQIRSVTDAMYDMKSTEEKLLLIRTMS